ncbi:5'-methylthioadenosine/adenosylhomocysteine nucleosidase [Rhodovibrionaceae bacterium A322]
MLAVVGAMEEEVALLRQDMQISGQEDHAGITVYRGSYQGVEMVLAQCGIGKVNATICTQMLIDLYQPAAFLFSGVAGGLLPNMQVGDLIVASHVIQYDMDLTAFGRRPGEVPGHGRMIEADPKLVDLSAQAYDTAFGQNEGKTNNGPNLMLGTVVSGDRFISDPKTLRWLQREFSALATEMEGAAVGYTCYLNKVPFVILRGLSDTAGSTASDDFEANLHLVCLNSHRLLVELIPLVGKA